MIASQSRAICFRSARRNDATLYWVATFGRRLNRLRIARRPPISRSLSHGTTIHSIPLSLALPARSSVRPIVKTVSRTPARLRLDRSWKLYVRSPASGGTGYIRVSQRHRSGLDPISVRSCIGFYCYTYLQEFLLIHRNSVRHPRSAGLNRSIPVFTPETTSRCASHETSHRSAPRETRQRLTCARRSSEQIRRRHSIGFAKYRAQDRS